MLRRRVRPPFSYPTHRPQASCACRQIPRQKVSRIPRSPFLPLRCLGTPPCLSSKRSPLDRSVFILQLLATVSHRRWPHTMWSTPCMACTLPIREDATACVHNFLIANSRSRVLAACLCARSSHVVEGVSNLALLAPPVHHTAVMNICH